jgi:hypothetical protein
VNRYEPRGYRRVMVYIAGVVLDAGAGWRVAAWIAGLW